MDQIPAGARLGYQGNHEARFGIAINAATIPKCRGKSCHHRPAAKTCQAVLADVEGLVMEAVYALAMRLVGAARRRRGSFRSSIA